MDDKSIMPFGKYKGKAMANVPAEYLLYLLNNGLDHAAIKAYILDNLEGLRQEVASHKRYGR